MQKAVTQQNQNRLHSEAVKNKIRWLRISYWVGAILDGLYVILNSSELAKGGAHEQ